MQNQLVLEETFRYIELLEVENESSQVALESNILSLKNGMKTVSYAV
ncbi:hypothetical protein NRIC_33580 [Enterococcus florum]|uniref:Uncharacterized protein n=1 Tax=Enterococcus florum TaxID=2480627 RepID=A0A4P5PBD8_9ENTE|nr:hypothetical protein NRIC_33580 [Enterococcus florum]